MRQAKAGTIGSLVLPSSRKGRKTAKVVTFAQASTPSREPTPTSKPKPKPKLTTLPHKVQLKIFSYLDLVTSVCLGLTTKELYAIHKSLYGVQTISLLSRTPFFGTGYRVKRFCLCELLCDWLKNMLSRKRWDQYARIAGKLNLRDQLQLRKWVKAFKDFPRSEVKEGILQVLADSLTKEAEQIVLRCSREELNWFLAEIA